MSMKTESSQSETQELELKLAIFPSELDRLLNSDVLNSSDSVQAAGVTPLKNIYYDTSAADLAKHKVAVRIRFKGDRYIQTLKTMGTTVGGVHQRGEWEWDVATPELNHQYLTQPHWPDGVQGLEHALKPVFNTDFERKQWDLTLPTALDGHTSKASQEMGLSLSELGPVKIEMVVDQGKVVMTDRHAALKRASVFSHQVEGQHTEPLSEIEFELKQGSFQDGVQAMYQLAMSVSDVAAVRLCDVSKAERGYRLLNGELYLQGIREKANQHNKIPLNVDEWPTVIEDCFTAFLRTWECGENAPQSEFLRLAFMHISRLTCLLSIVKLSAKNPEASEAALKAAVGVASFVLKQITWVEYHVLQGQQPNRSELMSAFASCHRLCGQQLLKLGYWIFLERSNPTSIDLKSDALNLQWRDQLRDLLNTLSEAPNPGLQDLTQALCLLVAPKWHEIWTGIPGPLRLQISELFQNIYGVARHQARDELTTMDESLRGNDEGRQDVILEEIMIKHWLQVLNGR